MSNELKYFGNYRAKVLSHGDHGLVKLFVYGVTPTKFETEYSDLPWAEPASPLFAGTNNGNGMFSYPNIGSFVWCFFENGDHLKPIYFAATLGGENAKGQYGVARPMPGTGDKDAYVHVINSGSSYVRISETGTITLKVRGAGGKFAELVLDSSGNIFLNASDQISLKTPLNIVETAGQQHAIDTKNYNAQIGQKYTVTSPSVLLDASDGAIVLKGTSTQVI